MGLGKQGVLIQQRVKERSVIMVKRIKIRLKKGRKRGAVETMEREREIEGQGKTKERGEIDQETKNKTKTREVIETAPKKEEGQGRIKIVQGQIKRKEETIKMELKETMMTKKEVRKEKRKEEKKEETQIEIMAETKT